nr:HEAT repeat domain-containing protein [Candidatus Freyarchaeota archaeon]
MSPKESGNWERFYNSFFGDPYWAWHDGLDFDALHQLSPEEKEKAEELFLERVNENDTRAAVGLGELRSKKAVPRLRELLDKARGRELVDIAVALGEIEGDKSYAKYIIHVLKNDSWWYDRLWAARHLREFDSPEVVEALFEAVKDPDYLVRNHACESLLYLHGFEPEISSHKEIFKNIITPHEGEPSEEDNKKYEAAVNQLRKMFREKEPAGSYS